MTVGLFEVPLGLDWTSIEKGQASTKNANSLFDFGQKRELFCILEWECKLTAWFWTKTRVILYPRLGRGNRFSQFSTSWAGSIRPQLIGLKTGLNLFFFFFWKPYDYYQKVLFCRPNYNGFKHLWVVIIFI